MKTKAHIISHTHWDREWYLPYEKHHMQLIRVMDSLLETFEKDPNFASFHLDGQTIILDDYLEVRPQHREKITQLIKEGKLIVGPWYILQDEFLTSSEANVRNLQIGMRDAARYGQICRIGYFPDSFGNIGQAPQLLLQAGIECAVFGRGVKPTGFNNEVQDAQGYESPFSEMWWQSPDGSAVLGVLFANWYNNGVEIPANSQDAAIYWEQKLADARKYAATEHLLFMNGCDHQPIQTDLSLALQTARELHPEVEFIHSDFPSYVQSLKDSLPEHLVTVRGELRSQQTNGWGTLVNTASARTYIKQANQKGQVMLEKVAEPLAVMAALAGIAYPHDELTYAWKLLMQNHPHDSICGCSVDDVHAEMMIRFAKSLVVAEAIIDESAKRIGSRIDTKAFTSNTDTYVVPFVVFNTTGWSRSGIICTELELQRLPFDWSSRETSIAILKEMETSLGEIVDEKGKSLPFTIEDLGVKFGYELPDDKFRQPYLARTIRVHVQVEQVPQLGYQTLAWRSKSADSAVSKNELTRIETAVQAESTLENEYLHVLIQKDGRLTLTDKRQGNVFTDLLIYENVGDVGNEYVFRQPINDVTLTTRGIDAEIVVKENSELRQVVEVIHRWDIPEEADERLAEEARELVYFLDRKAARNEQTVTLEIHTEITLAKGSARLDIVTSFDNQAKDHRLRVLIPTDVKTSEVYADSVFEIAQRQIEPDPEWSNPSHCQHQQAFVNVYDEKAGMTVANLGLPEYEIVRDGRNTIAVTLLRAVSELGDWGHFPTPDAQCLGKQSFAYSVIPHGATVEERNTSLQEAYQFQIPWTVQQLASGHAANHAAPTNSFFTWRGNNLAFSSMKLERESEDVMLRWFEMNGQASELQVNGSTKAGFYRSDILERKGDDLSPIEVENSTVALSIKPFEIVTLGYALKAARSHN
ncbi:alpha-mannosidase [Paenibacillus pectinilyticus]|uniref:Alpha-mannosidase n=1 Tax=Paenibacillus pectinilyticus TaxID=512399 RepID=A0A1C1A3Y7_9BACL|nr:alpha-mannosidase [Paenibacillus pectinilyticus]OCT15265.1 alpha-mannosidase [Paenibacillus pectinilyticus]